MHDTASAVRDAAAATTAPARRSPAPGALLLGSTLTGLWTGLGRGPGGARRRAPRLRRLSRHAARRRSRGPASGGARRASALRRATPTRCSSPTSPAASSRRNPAGRGDQRLGERPRAEAARYRLTREARAERHRGRGDRRRAAAIVVTRTGARRLLWRIERPAPPRRAGPGLRESGVPWLRARRRRRASLDANAAATALGDGAADARRLLADLPLRPDGVHGSPAAARRCAPSSSPAPRAAATCC